MRGEGVSGEEGKGTEILTGAWRKQRSTLVSRG